ncbi:MAG TPA: DUF1707 domain-containing protein [Blastococcus sp.]|jgi:hypothetical protein|nr:DUF1707 domain-containing protein [Blastococcus sp.]
MGVERERLRVSDAERQAAVDSLRVAFSDGRLALHEYDERIGRAYGAVTYGDLDRLFTDLPRPQVVTTTPPYRPYPQAGAPEPFTGRVRNTALQVLLFVVTLGIWGFVYVFLTHDEMKRHSGVGLGGVLALILSLFVRVASPFLLSHEVGGLYERAGRRRPVSALTGLWFFPGILLLVGPLIWFVLTNRALNGYWRGSGAR